MSKSHDENSVKSANKSNDLESIIGNKERRKLRSRRRGKDSAWFGLGMFGLVGWSIVVPTLLGIALGAWIDHQWPSHVSWKLTFLFLGVLIGCGNVWYWIQKETRH